MPTLFQIGQKLAQTNKLQPPMNNVLRLAHSVLFTVLLTAPLMAQENNTTPRINQSGLGSQTSATPDIIESDTSLGSINPTEKYTEAAYSTGGVGLRNRGAGNIAISGVTTPVKAAYVYWAVITSGAAPTADTSIKIQRLAPTPISAVTTVKGTSMGVGSTPCWGGDRITIFRGSVPMSVANGNGSYQIELEPGASGTTGGADPSLSAILPLFEGASLVVVGKGSATVTLYDTNLAGHTFASTTGISYTLELPTAAPGTLALFDDIGADGQHGVGRKAEVNYAEKYTRINSKLIAGPGSPYVDTDWNGSAGLPLTQLWDDTGHDITETAPKGTKTLDVDFSGASGSQYDCLTTVANVVSVQ